MEFLGLTISTEMLEQWVFVYGMRLIAAAIILTLGWIAAKAIRTVSARLMERAHFEKILVNFLSNILYALVLAFVIIASLNKLGIQTASLIAIIGAAGLAIGLALQGSLSNFAAGVMIILFKHFKLGDFIQGGGVQGTVVDMNIFHTTLHTPSNERVVVPNAGFTTGPMTNFTANATRRVDITISISHESDLDKAQEIIERLVTGHDKVLKDPAPYVAIDALTENGMNFVVFPWSKKEDYGVVKKDLLRDIKLEFDCAGIAIPHPQRDVHMVSVPRQMANGSQRGGH